MRAATTAWAYNIPSKRLRPYELRQNAECCGAIIGCFATCTAYSSTAYHSGDTRARPMYDDKMRLWLCLDVPILRSILRGTVVEHVVFKSSFSRGKSFFLRPGDLLDETECLPFRPSWHFCKSQGHSVRSILLQQLDPGVEKALLTPLPLETSFWGKLLGISIGKGFGALDGLTLLAPHSRYGDKTIGISYSKRSCCWQNAIDTARCCHLPSNDTRCWRAGLGMCQADLRRGEAAVVAAKSATRCCRILLCGT